MWCRDALREKYVFIAQNTTNNVLSRNDPVHLYVVRLGADRAYTLEERKIMQFTYIQKVKMNFTEMRKLKFVYFQISVMKRTKVLIV